MKTIEFTKEKYTFLEKSLSSLSKGKVLVIGDIMLDQSLFGDSTRISPEAPVPVVKIEKSVKALGGAANVARSIVNLGGKASIFGIVGKDTTAEEMHDLLQKEGICDHLFALDNRTTTLKVRVLARGQQMIRMDTEDCTPLDKEELQLFINALSEVLPDYEYIIISDYAKGLIKKDLVDFLTSFTNKEGKKLKILADPKPSHKELYKNLFLLTPNAKETAELSHKEFHNLEEAEVVGRTLKEELKLDNLLTTLGAQGMALFNEKNEVWHIPTTARQVFDVTGAGDTVIATLALALSAGIDLLDACILANHAAGVVVAKIGSATVSQEELGEALKSDFIQ